MPNNIVICCGGTGNELGDHNSTVVKLYSTLLIDDHRQIGYDHSRVATIRALTASNRLSAGWSVVKGLGFGAGLLANFGDAYRYRMDSVNDSDEVFIVGFGLGAYTARALAAVLHLFGCCAQETTVYTSPALRQEKPQSRPSAVRSVRPAQACLAV